MGHDGVYAALRDLTSCRSGTVRSRYLVAADGIHSTVRQALNIAMPGSERLAERIGVQFRAPLWSLLGEERYVIYPITSSERGSTPIPALRTPRLRQARR